jgi:hypothetical protein
VLSVEHEPPRRERVATAVALRAAGESVARSPSSWACTLRTAHRYLAAGSCPGCGGPALCGTHCRDCAPRNRPAATGEEIVAALRAWQAEHGAPRREPDWTSACRIWRDAWPRWPGTATVLRVFGSWNAALEAAGLPTHCYAWGREEALERLAGWARVHGRPPTIADARVDPGLPGPYDLPAALYGSWNAALRAAELTPQHEAHR